jgi:hypothetical protein
MEGFFKAKGCGELWCVELFLLVLLMEKRGQGPIQQQQHSDSFNKILLALIVK